MKKLFIIFGLLALAGAGCSFTSAPLTACDYNGQTYAAGQSFPSDDGCNTCACGEDGGVQCTERACANTQAIQTCQSDADCQGDEGFDTSFCPNGSWHCRDRQCTFSCDVTELTQ